MSSMSGQPQMGQPNTNGNAGLAPINPVPDQELTHQQNASFVAQPDGNTPGNPYPNTIGGTSNPAGQPMGKGGGGNNSANSSNTANSGQGA